MYSKTSLCAGNSSERDFKTISIGNIKDISLEGFVLTIVESENTHEFDLGSTCLQIRGKADGDARVLELEIDAPPLLGRQLVHYIPIDPADRFAGMIIDRFRPCGSEGKHYAFGMVFIGIGISDIDDITKGVQKTNCSHTQQVSEIFKLIEDRSGTISEKAIELQMSPAFPGAVQIRFLAHEEGETANYFLSARPMSNT